VPIFFDSAPYGWPVKKGSALAASLQKAARAPYRDRDYKTIASNWGVEAGMIDKPVVQRRNQLIARSADER